MYDHSDSFDGATKCPSTGASFPTEHLQHPKNEKDFGGGIINRIVQSKMGIGMAY
jgi:hypothetical protein